MIGQSVRSRKKINIIVRQYCRLTSFRVFRPVKNFWLNYSLIINFINYEISFQVPFPNRPFITHYEMQMTSDGQIHCLEVIIALIKKVLGDSPALNAIKVIFLCFSIFKNLQAAMVQTFQMKCKSTVQYEPVMTTMEYARMDRAAKIIQNAWREWYYEKVKFSRWKLVQRIF